MCREEDDSNILQLRSLENYDSDDEEKDDSSDYVDNSNAGGTYEEWHIRLRSNYFDTYLIRRQ